MPWKIIANKPNREALIIYDVLQGTQLDVRHLFVDDCGEVDWWQPSRLAGPPFSSDFTTNRTTYNSDLTANRITPRPYNCDYASNRMNGRHYSSDFAASHHSTTFPRSNGDYRSDYRNSYPHTSDFHNDFLSQSYMRHVASQSLNDFDYRPPFRSYERRWWMLRLAKTFVAKIAKLLNQWIWHSIKKKRICVEST